jgi:cyclopropane-fatty-acyl-phospholipid synthase
VRVVAASGSVDAGHGQRRPQPGRSRTQARGERVSAQRRASLRPERPAGYYSLFLDRDRQYSCAYFPRGDETLEEAQLAKKRHIAAKLCSTGRT